MTIFLKEHFNIYTIGDADFLNSFFSTVYYNLENRKWGSCFPIIMNELYQGKVHNRNVKKCIDEIIAIIKETRKLDINKLIWDFEDLRKLPTKNIVI
ncbi:MAG: immunity 70 family protein [Elusimicrobiota bacterium]|nr:immunity 70 family protein [Elusimicrobiota bacterium]